MTVFKQSKRAVATAVAIALGTWQVTARAQQDVDDAATPDEEAINYCVLNDAVVNKSALARILVL